MKQIVKLLSLCIAFPYYLIAQKTPQFLTMFYFEDAIGNRDSIEIGYDLTASHRGNPDFGEISDLSPFKGIFDVRAVNYFAYFNTTPPIDPLNLIVKRIVGGAEKVVNANCIGGDFLIFFIHAIHQPITISAKSVKDFEKIDCPGRNTWNFFSPDHEYHFIEPWGWASTPGVRYGCLKDSTYTLYLGTGLGSESERPYTLIYEIEGIGIDTIYGVEFVMDHTFYQCDSNYVDAKQFEQDGEEMIFPNPTHNYIEIQNLGTESPIKCSVYNQCGIIVRNYNWNDSDKIQLHLEGFSSGVYFIQIHYRNGSVTKKFLKI